jgi:hypothetical protein
MDPEKMTAKDRFCKERCGLMEFMLKSGS